MTEIKRGGPARIFQGSEIPNNFRIFTEFWNREPKHGEQVGEVFWPEPHAFLYWIVEGGEGSIHVLGRKIEK